MSITLEMQVLYVQAMDYGDFIESERVCMSAVRGPEAVRLQVPVPLDADPRQLKLVVEPFSATITLGERSVTYTSTTQLDSDAAKARIQKIKKEQFKTPATQVLHVTIPLIRDKKAAFRDALKCTGALSEAKPESKEVSSESETTEEEEILPDPVSGPVVPVDVLPKEETEAELHLASLRALAKGWAKSTGVSKKETKGDIQVALQNVRNNFVSGTGVSFSIHDVVFSLTNPLLETAITTPVGQDEQKA
ncbi:hypothetical protein GMRT_10914 [Giardia muris]|uniref:Uncharacterized protein n=1 Tax=Giardia muris TaxID=5742 RepID=A0A4Z1T0F5_GIAMU|nr:hypothetical protein GMRT_10914 [Giardia muris]|eukprot:TNJ30465.1 hypothetical protein GMRT_10914 [Giardia muris]